MVEINVYLVQMICNQKPRKYASEINNNVLLCKNIYCGGNKCLCCTNVFCLYLLFLVRERNKLVICSVILDFVCCFMVNI